MLEELIKNPNIKTAEEVINGIDTDPAYEAVEGIKPSYEDYDTDIDLIFKFRDRLKASEESIEAINYILNQKAVKYEGESKRCPKCGRAMDLVGNDGHFCKFCGAHIKTPVTKSFGQTLEELRRESDYKLVEFGKAVGRSASYIWNLENGKREPTLDDCIRFSRFFKCSVNKLFGQDEPRKKIESKVPAEMMTYQENLPSIEVREVIKEENVEGYSLDDEYIFRCPHCGREIDLTPMEALSLSLSSYEVMKMRSHGNDGNFCKHCGQGIIRPVKIDKNKALHSYSYWINYAAKKVKK